MSGQGVEATRFTPTPAKAEGGSEATTTALPLQARKQDDPDCHRNAISIR